MVSSFLAQEPNQESVFLLPSPCCRIHEAFERRYDVLWVPGPLTWESARTGELIRQFEALVSIGMKWRGSLLMRSLSVTNIRANSLLPGLVDSVRSMPHHAGKVDPDHSPQYWLHPVFCASVSHLRQA
jgi:hypothetical protein